MKELKLTWKDEYGIKNYNLERFFGMDRERKVKIKYLVQDNYDISDEEEIHVLDIDEFRELVFTNNDENTSAEMINCCGKHILTTSEEYLGETIINEFEILSIA